MPIFFDGEGFVDSAGPLVDQSVSDKKLVPELLPPWKLEGSPWAVLTGSGFLGAYSGGLIVLLRRYRQFDLRPPAFLQLAVVLIAGTACGAFVTMLYPSTRLGTLSFAIGFLAAINVRFLANLMHAQFAKMTGSKIEASIPTDLSEVVKNSEAIESLNRMSIFSIQELANADPIRLYLNMPQQVEVVHALIDRALLLFYFKDAVHDLGKLHLHRFSQLLVACLDSGMEFEFRKKVSFFESEFANEKLLQSVEGIIETGLHHRTIALLLRPYRETFFPRT